MAISPAANSRLDGIRDGTLMTFTAAWRCPEDALSGDGEETPMKHRLHVVGDAPSDISKDARSFRSPRLRDVAERHDSGTEYLIQRWKVGRGRKGVIRDRTGIIVVGGGLRRRKGIDAGSGRRICGGRGSS